MNARSPSRQRGSSIQRVDLASGPRWRFRVDVGVDDAGKRQQRTFTFKSEREAVEAQAPAPSVRHDRCIH